MKFITTIFLFLCLTMCNSLMSEEWDWYITTLNFQGNLEKTTVDVRPFGTALTIRNTETKAPVLELTGVTSEGTSPTGDISQYLEVLTEDIERHLHKEDPISTNVPSQRLVRVKDTRTNKELIDLIYGGGRACVHGYNSKEEDGIRLYAPIPTASVKTLPILIYLASSCFYIPENSRRKTIATAIAEMHEREQSRGAGE